MIARLLHALLLCVLLVGAAQAQDAPERTIFDIQLKEDARLAGGKSAFLEGQTNPYGQQFQVLGTQLQQPIAVGLYTPDPSRPLKLRITKGSFDEPLRELETGADGRIDLKFRTYDGFKLWVTATEPSDYQLVVWVGNEMAVHPPRVVIPASEYAAAAAGSTAGMGGLLAGRSRLEIGMGIALLLVVVVLGFVFLSRRKNSRGTP
ncbi:MAG: hypothetical protein ABI588_04895 [Arenimonas sp.]